MMQEIITDVVMQKVATGKPFTLLLLVNGVSLPEDKGRAQQMQMDHLSHLFTLEQKGEISVFGPINNNEKYGGLIIFNTTDKDSIKELMNNDPYVNGGHFTYELFDFFSIPGQQIV